MEFTEEKRGEVKIVGLCGRLDITSCPSVEKLFASLVTQGDIRIALDFSKLSYISSLGLRTVMELSKQLQTAGGRLAFANLNDDIRSMFEIAGIMQLFSVYKTLDEAVTYCTG